MKFITFKNLLLAAGVAACGVSLASAQATTISVPLPVNEGASSTAETPVPTPVISAAQTPVMSSPSPTAIQAAIDSFSAKRDALIAARQTILDQLKAATPEQRQAIIDKMRADAKDILSQQRALGKAIRDQMRELRKTAPTTGSGG